MIARGPGGDRVIGAADFFVDYLTTALTPGEILDWGPGAQTRPGMGLSL